jgi:hypothetical protein
LSDGLFDFPAKILKSFHIWVPINFNMSHTRWLPLKKKPAYKETGNWPVHVSEFHAGVLCSVYESACRI